MKPGSEQLTHCNLLVKLTATGINNNNIFVLKNYLFPCDHKLVNDVSWMTYSAEQATVGTIHAYVQELS